MYSLVAWRDNLPTVLRWIIGSSNFSAYLDLDHQGLKFIFVCLCRSPVKGKRLLAYLFLLFFCLVLFILIEDE